MDHQMNRRGFLKYVGVGLGAVAISSLAPKTLLGEASFVDTGAISSVKGTGTSLWLLSTGEHRCLNARLYESAKSAIEAGR